MKRPLIGITPGFSAENDRIYTNRGYPEGVSRAGGLAVLLPLCEDTGVIAEAVDRCDGIILAGGPDLDARFFGEENLSFTGAISPLRDEMELFAARRAFELKKPVLGICRGAQVLNAALGGTIYQDIYAQLKDSVLLKHTQDAPGWYPVHGVRLGNGSILSGCYGGPDAAVNSFHHQAIRVPGGGLVVSARSSDGVVEAIESENGAFTVGVQWHPELMWRKDPGSFKLFETFVRAAGERME